MQQTLDYGTEHFTSKCSKEKSKYSKWLTMNFSLIYPTHAEFQCILFLRKPTTCCTRIKCTNLFKLLVATNSVFVVVISHTKQHSLETFQYFISSVWWARFIDSKTAELFLLVTKNTKLLWQVSLNGGYSTMLIIQHSIWVWQWNDAEETSMSAGI